MKTYSTKNVLSALLLFGTFCHSVYAQESLAVSAQLEIDSLIAIIERNEKDTSAISARLAWAELIFDANPDSAILLAQESLNFVERCLETDLDNPIRDACLKFKSDALNDIGYYYSSNDVPLAVEFLEQSIAHSEMIGYYDGLKASIWNLGETYRNNYEFDSALVLFNKRLQLANENGDKKSISSSFFWIGKVYTDKTDLDSALLMYKQALLFIKEEGEKELMSNILHQIGYTYSDLSKPHIAIDYYVRSLELGQEYGEAEDGQAISMFNIGVVYNELGDIQKALEYWGMSLSMFERINHKEGMAAAYQSLGLLYLEQGDMVKGMEYASRSMEVREEIGDTVGIAYAYNNLGYNYHQRSRDESNRQSLRDSSLLEAIKYYSKSLEIQEFAKNNKGISIALHNLGSAYFESGNVEKARPFWERALAIREKTGDKRGIVYTSVKLGNLHLSENNINTADKYAKRAYKLAVELDYPEGLKRSAELMKKLSVKQGNYRKAMEYYEQEILMTDSLVNEENQKTAFRQQARYEYAKKAAADSVAHSKALEIKNLELARVEQEKMKQRIAIFSLVGGFFLILIFSVWLYRLLVDKRRANQLLGEQNVVITKKNSEITTQKEEIEDSIRYARRIQSAMLPEMEYINEIAGEHFIIFRPKDVVSGDFYWSARLDNNLIITAADCTGHGVPGAFMSMLGISFLNEIVTKKEIIYPAQILNELRKMIIEALRQTGGEGTQKDGMDMSLASIDLKSRTCMWAGANNPIWIIRKDAVPRPDQETAEMIEEIKGDRMPVAIHERMDDFTEHKIELNKGDKLYLFTDGFPDQFGGPKGKKFQSKPFKRLIAETFSDGMHEQCKAVEEKMNAWMEPDDQPYEQIDDITIIGLQMD